MARRRSKVSTEAIAVIGGALLLFPILTMRAQAAGTNPKMLINIYTKGTCAINPQDEDPNDQHQFSFNVSWSYMQNGVEVANGRVARITTDQAHGIDVDLTQALDPVPDYIRLSNPSGLAPNDWTTYECPSPPNPSIPFISSGLCDPKKPIKGCCFLGVPTGNPAETINHSLDYFIANDPCLDCHYEACEQFHAVPKGGGVPMVFKYIRTGGDCDQVPAEYCDQFTNDAPCGWGEGPFGPYRRKCYILIR